MSFKILLIENYLPDQQHSMLRYGEVLRNELLKAGCEVSSIRPKAIFTKIPGLRPFRKWLGYLDKYIIFPITLRLSPLPYDIAHIVDHSNAVYEKHILGPKVMITCHDLLAIRAALGEIPQQQVSKTGKILQAWIRSSLSRIKYVMVDSKASLEDLNRICPPKSGAIRDVIDIGLLLSKPDLNSPPLQNSPYFLHVGGNDWYKNREYVVEVFSNLRKTDTFAHHKLILVGKPPSLELQRRIDTSGLNSEIECQSGVGDDDLINYYHHAEALLFPSLFEGFGLPIIEAQSQMTWVITTNKDPMKDLTGKGGTLIPTEDAAEACEIIIREHAKKSSLIDFGTQNLERFSIPRMIKNIKGFYQKAISSHP